MSQDTLAPTTSTRLELGGMGCSSCAATIESALGALPGVRTACVDFDAKQAEVIHTPQIKGHELAAAVVAAGYKATVL